jgi:hypothetical protein
MLLRKQVALACAGLFFLATVAGSADLMVYPKDGQNAEQQKKDEFECYDWAKGQSGFDPMARPTASSPPPQQQATQGGAVRGAARGAAVGAAVGAIAGDAGKGAAIGAAGGGVGGGMRRRNQQNQQAAEQNAWEQEQIARYEQQRSQYNRAYSVCLEGRGYSVK